MRNACVNFGRHFISRGHGRVEILALREKGPEPMLTDSVVSSVSDA